MERNMTKTKTNSYF